MKVGTIQEDASVFHEASRRVAVFVGLDDAIFALGFELPLVVSESFGGLDDTLDILFVDKVRAIATTALRHVRGITVKNTFAAVVKDASPVAFQKRHVKDVGAVLVVVFKTDPLMGL